MENEKKQPLGLFKKLLEIQKKVRGLGKDDKTNQYRYVSGSKVLIHVRPLMDEYGILLKQEVCDVSNTRMDYKTKNGEKSEILTSCEMRFTWIDTETGETDVSQFHANGQNDWEKGLGSALTYAERYFLLKFFHIPTDEDDVDNDNRKLPPLTKKEPTKKPDLVVATKEYNGCVTAMSIMNEKTGVNYSVADFRLKYEISADVEKLLIEDYNFKTNPVQIPNSQEQNAI